MGKASERYEPEILPESVVAAALRMCLKIMGIGIWGAEKGHEESSPGPLKILSIRFGVIEQLLANARGFIDWVFGTHR